MSDSLAKRSTTCLEGRLIRNIFVVRASRDPCAIVTHRLDWRQRSRAASRQFGYLKTKPRSRSLAGTTRRLFRISSVSVRMKMAPASSITLFADRPNGIPAA